MAQGVGLVFYVYHTLVLPYLRYNRLLYRRGRMFAFRSKGLRFDLRPGREIC